MSLTTGGQIKQSPGILHRVFDRLFIRLRYTAGQIHRVVKAAYNSLDDIYIRNILHLGFICFGKEGILSLRSGTKAYLAGGEYLLIMGYSQLFMMLEITMQGVFTE